MIGSHILHVVRDSIRGYGYDDFEEFDGEECAQAVVDEMRREQVRADFAKDEPRAAAFKLVADWMER